ncbi:DNA translocase FtsK [Gordonia phosphorivorans]|uniref:DNA translocase FtsK n=1 Tax=Gordonia phosphorivorans TaxID=1056982 RepID=A0ABV6H6K4_9ACTN
MTATEIASGRSITLLDVTVPTAQLRAALIACRPHVDKPPADSSQKLARTRVWAAGDQLLVGATDRQTVALAAVHVTDSSPDSDAGQFDLAPIDVKKILAVFQITNAKLADDYFVRLVWRAAISTTTTAVTGEPAADAVATWLHLTDVSGLLSGDELELTGMTTSDDFPDIPAQIARWCALPTCAGADAFGVPELVLDRFRVAAKAYEQAVTISAPSDIHLMLWQIGDHFLGAATAGRIDLTGSEETATDSALALRRARDRWQHRLPTPIPGDPDMVTVWNATAVDLDETPEDGDDTPEPSLDGLDQELVIAAARLVVESQFGSASMLQRKLRIGYAKAGRVLDVLARFRVVGSSQGATVTRLVLARPADLPEITAEITDSHPDAGAPDA